MNIETGFEEITNGKLIELAEQNFGYLPVVAELLNRFTTLVDNWKVLNSQAMDAVTEKQEAEKKTAFVLADVERLCRQNNLMRIGLNEIIRYLKESEDEILMSSGVEVSIHIQEIVKRISNGLSQISEVKK